MSNKFTEDERRRLIKIGRQLGTLSEDDITFMEKKTTGERRCRRQLTYARYRKINEELSASHTLYMRRKAVSKNA